MLAIFFQLLLIVSPILPQDLNLNPFYFNPGIKFCYEFGKKHGFTIGPELSMGALYENGTILGAVIGKQWNLRTKRRTSYLEFEGGHALLGGAFGIESSNDQSNLKFRFRGFAGCMLYLSMKYSPSVNPFELGLVIKIPFVHLVLPYLMDLTSDFRH